MGDDCIGTIHSRFKGELSYELYRVDHAGRKCGRAIDVRAFETAEMGKRLAEFKLEKTIGFFRLDFFLFGTN